MDKYLEWGRLIGLPVEIRHQGETIGSGIVDAAMPDSSIIWLAPDSARHRTLYERGLQHEVWVDINLVVHSSSRERIQIV